MGNSQNGLIITIVILISMSAFFSASETAFSSLNKIRLKNYAKKGNKKAISALKISDQYNNALSTILIGNTVVNIAAASISTIIFTSWYGNSGVTISTIVVTTLLLIFGEVTPKSIAKEHSESFAMAVSPFLWLFIIIFAPINKLFMLWKSLVSKMFKGNDNPSITEQELMVIIDEVENEGVINEQERELIKSAIEFDDISVSEIITPRVDIIACDICTSTEDILKLFFTHGFSRMPVYDNTIDHIIGIILEKDFCRQYFENREVDIKSILKEVSFVPKTAKISVLLKMLQKTTVQMAVVVDHYGGTLGIVSLEDILEELVGDIWDEHDEIITSFTKLAQNKYLISGNADVDDMFDYLNMNADKYDFEPISVSGWVIQTFSKIPQIGESFVYDNLKVTVTKTHTRRVLEIVVEVMNTTQNDGL